MLNINQFRDLIVKSSLNDLLLYSPEAEELMVFTCAVESNGGTYIHQIRGPALGIYQMDPETYNDIWFNYVIPNHQIGLKLFNNFDVHRTPSEARLIYDLRFATAMTRLFYLRIQEPLPAQDNVDSIWEYYKKYYNTSNGKAEKEDSIKKYHDFVRSRH